MDLCFFSVGFVHSTSNFKRAYMNEHNVHTHTLVQTKEYRHIRFRSSFFGFPSVDVRMRKFSLENIYFRSFFIFLLLLLSFYFSSAVAVVFQTHIITIITLFLSLASITRVYTRSLLIFRNFHSSNVIHSHSLSLVRYVFFFSFLFILFIVSAPCPPLFEFIFYGFFFSITLFLGISLSLSH